MRITNQNSIRAFQQQQAMAKRPQQAAKEHTAKSDMAQISAEAKQAKSAQIKMNQARNNKTQQTPNPQTQLRGAKQSGFSNPVMQPGGAPKGVSSEATIQFSERTAVSFSTKG